MKTPRERWGTCCPSDPECEHSFMEGPEFDAWFDTPLSDEKAQELEELK